MSVCFLNARSIKNKLVYLNNFVQNSTYDIIFIVETWLNDNVKDSLICPTGYDIIRRDRKSKRGGGLLVLFKSQYTIIEIRETENTPIEYMCVDVIHANTNQTLRFFCSYVPPDISRDRDNIKILCSSVLKHKLNSQLFYLIGDFNMPFISWPTLNSSNNCGNLFLDFCAENCLKQQVSEPTTTCGSLLDLALCDEISSRLLNSVEVLPPMSLTCDHCVVKLSFHLEQIAVYCKSIPKSFRYI